MNTKELKFGENARLAMKRGVDQTTNAIKISYGSMGRNAIIDKSYGAPLCTKDGISIIRDIVLEDKFENLGCQIIKEVSQKTNDAVGDASTGSAILAQAIISEGMKLVTSGINPIEIRKSLEKKIKEIVDKLKEMSKNISTDEEIFQVASISANDEEIGRVIADAIKEVGQDGLITIEEGQKSFIEKELVVGTKLDKGFYNNYFVTDIENMKAVLESPYILITDKKLSNIQELLPLLDKVMQTGKKDLVIVADEFEGEALTTLIVNKMKGIFSSLLIKAPGFGNTKKETLKDLAILTGGRFISDELGDKFDKVEISDLGQAHKVVSSRDDSLIIDGAGDKEKIAERIKEVKKEIEDSESKFDKENLGRRLSRLEGSMAVIKVGDLSDLARKEKMARIEDSLNAVKAAVAEGIVSGGGISLALASNIFSGEEFANDDYGSIILNKALLIPIKTIADNAGKDGSLILHEVISRNKNSEKTIGYNATTDTYECLMDTGVIDPVKVLRVSLEHAVSAAIMFLTAEVAIVNKEDKKQDEI